LDVNYDITSISIVTQQINTEVCFISIAEYNTLLKDFKIDHSLKTRGNILRTIVQKKSWKSPQDRCRGIFQKPSNFRTSQDINCALEYLNLVNFFNKFSNQVKMELCKVIKLINASANTVLCVEGNYGNHFYVIYSGKS